MTALHIFARYPFRNWAAKVARDLSFPGGLTYTARHSPDPRYPDAPWLVEGRWPDDSQAT